MRLFTLDEETKLPVISAEALTVKAFSDLWRRVKPIDGDRDGRKKEMNRRELGYVYFAGVYDSRFKTMSTEDKQKKIRDLLSLPKDWVLDDLVLNAIKEFIELQITPSSEMVHSLEGSMSAMAKWVKTANDRMSAGTMGVKDVSELQDIVERMPKTINSLSQAQIVLNKEQDELAKGRKGRDMNLFEMPD